MDIVTDYGQRDIKISLPNLVSVKGKLQIRFYVNELIAPKLQTARLNITTDLDKLEIPKTLTWSGTAYFNSKDFCEKYAYAFRDLQFITKPRCSLCNMSSFTITPQNHHLISLCEYIARSIVINQLSPSEISINTIKNVSGSITIGSIAGDIQAKSLRKIFNNITITNSSLKGTLLSNLKQSSH
ncbi:hypothetical protein DSO57_1034286 [Entomophthora muscae]|uniref:Uncharacterized protein n=1 Tax=Entomophthora muscae TaxID=34485 RepID=A0ACC2TAX9_9FUNG|nr:hypothetical protein DSO57_1034286 [Entomophthora muscae]